MNLKEIKERLHLECLERGDDVIVSIFKKNIIFLKKKIKKNKQEQDAAGVRTISPLKTSYEYPIGP